MTSSASNICFFIRVAIRACQRDAAGVREIVENLEPHDLDTLMRDLDETAAFFGQLISIAALAFERLKISAEGLGRDMSAYEG